ncbi:hypothetical protein F5Y07DRAFT_373077 [Xylaria sp. FL0933]|nr:hypothetical protein F5Y07DRAFT_373077 [Xylaria sp. FL0933]
MNGGKSSASNNKSTTNSEDERARLRRNQRNSRARKQAYIHDLEQRWNECVRLGAQASVEMQKEARRVQQENRLLRALLHKQGLDDVAIKEALDSLTGNEENSAQSPVFQRSAAYPAQASASLAAPDAQNNNSSESRSGPHGPPEALSLVNNYIPSNSRTNIYPEPNFDEWLTDLCNIKDAFTSDVLFTDQSLQCDNRLGTFPSLPSHIALNETQPNQALPQQDINTTIDLSQGRDCFNSDWQDMYQI